MKIGPKYKIARRLGAPVFEKTQTQKYALSLARKEQTRKGRTKPKSSYGLQLLEKQKARFTYGVNEKQFARNVKEVLALKTQGGPERLFERLEMRLDNTVFRAGFALTRLAARQMVSHGHIMVNGRKVNIPSMRLSVGDVVSIRTQSREKNLFAGLDERLKTHSMPAWLSVETPGKEVKVAAMPQYRKDDQMFDLNVVLEFYSR